MWRCTLPRFILPSVKLLSLPKSPIDPEKGDDPAMPWRAGEDNADITQAFKTNGLMSKLLDTAIARDDEAVRGRHRYEYQEPARYHYDKVTDECIALEEHDMEEFNEQPYITVNHLYEPPVGSAENPIRLEASGLPGDCVNVKCMGNCAPHVPAAVYHLKMKGYTMNQCMMCKQIFYIHNRPILVMNPDWTEDPANDDGPAFKFAEIETEFDRDFHEFTMYLGQE
uniref:Uncharacterized protein n=1 Tax=Paramoeba aestuarina TaxID=180227 RepID=A0A7S4NLZ5_9EUKA|mmetsp:Transcript_20199/g.31609  ORF Transcript_20199/g.31609 Transcript_20199/m.31609 type:complete len:225 (+) Transcript_20199:26-700(+)|eukprot:CAMPEP_0201507032 /NCGR_PEP_ID=MMETSP0161_2-20130828/836_1 /ASSEMBLY_ACC=CAM_ASM_000251 /TAXON_ID=180227 /ORGANISM="Neoparamoeba aestuarina, Strain SoJaBio B1-5/56/2" /LENGTH=224 /DNA_ID=CAMNT_0047901301 /DNA_START=25 /DNA_END=699 /DNA_ORIENTATION=-